ncbi:MAG: hypothetical protein ACRDZQ_10185, partial [Acidimicrobiales bacterium]
DSSSALLWQAQSGMRFSMPENHFGTGPRPVPTLGPLATALSGAEATGRLPPSPEDPVLRTWLRKACVASVVAGPMAHEAAVVALVSRVVGHGPRRAGGVELWTGLAGPPCSEA